MWISPCETASKAGTASFIISQYIIHFSRFRNVAGAENVSLC
jgi:hypothetical protein